MTVARAFDEVIDRMLALSPSFRRQCRRLALAAPGLWLEVFVEARRTAVRARTVIERHEGRLARATMFLPASADAVELIAHEVEHLLEQADDIDLRRHVAAGVAWTRGDGAYETRRAVEAGRRVAEEVAAALAGAAR